MLGVITDDLGSILPILFTQDWRERFASLNPNIQGSLKQILSAAVAGPMTVFPSQNDSYYLSLAQQFLTIAPQWLVDDVSKIQYFIHAGFEQDDNPENLARIIWYPIGLFSKAVTNQRAAFIPITSEPGLTTPVRTGTGELVITSPSSGGSQELQLPFRDLNTPTPSVPVTFQQSTNETPGSISTPIDNTPSIAPEESNNWIWLILAGFLLLSQNKKT